MKHMTITDVEYAGKHNQARKELLLIEMDRVVPYKEPCEGADGVFHQLEYVEHEFLCANHLQLLQQNSNYGVYRLGR